MATPNLTTVRLDILQTIKEAFASIDANQPVSDPYGIQFSTVEIGPLAPWDQRKMYSCGLHVGPEKETFQFPYIMCWLTLNVEFRATWNRDAPVTPGELAEQVLGVCKRKMTEDRTWGGRAIDTKVVGSEVDLVTYWDRSVVGVAVCEVQYRYSHLDPRNPNPDV